MIEKLIKPESEEEIISNWKFKDEVYVSCICITFNQKDYIEDALDGMLSQVTDYRFEIIIHDDCSTDGTRDLILDYKKKYPSIIKLALQSENQYSKGIRITPLAVSFSSGKYVAICEGDDFWIDKYKIHKQLQALEKHKDSNICFTAAIGLYPNKTEKVINKHAAELTVFSKEDVFCGGGGFMPTPSLMIRSCVFENLPSFFYKASVGDYYLQTISSKLGGAIYLPDCSVVYRYFSLSSWSNKSLNYSSEKIKMHYRQDIDSIHLLARYINANLEALDTAVSKLQYHSACLALSSGHYALFKIYITKSFLRKKGISYKQLIYYKFRCFPFILSSIKKLSFKRTV